MLLVYEDCKLTVSCIEYHLISVIVMSKKTSIVSSPFPYYRDEGKGTVTKSVYTVSG